jgi:hypothetical protein
MNGRFIPEPEDNEVDEKTQRKEAWSNKHRKDREYDRKYGDDEDYEN